MFEIIHTKGCLDNIVMVSNTLNCQKRLHPVPQQQEQGVAVRYKWRRYFQINKTRKEWYLYEILIELLEWINLAFT